MSQHVSHASSDRLRDVHRNAAARDLARPQAGTGPSYAQIEVPYDRIVDEHDEYEMPDGEIVQRSDAIWRGDRW